MTPLKKPLVQLADYTKSLIERSRGLSGVHLGVKTEFSKRCKISRALLNRYEGNPDYHVLQLAGKKGAIVKVVRVFDE